MTSVGTNSPRSQAEHKIDLGASSRHRARDYLFRQSPSSALISGGVTIEQRLATMDGTSYYMDHSSLSMVNDNNFNILEWQHLNMANTSPETYPSPWQYQDFRTRTTLSLIFDEVYLTRP